MIFLQLSQQLQSLSSLLLNLTDEQFTKKIVHLDNSSIGGHTKHVIELLQCAMDGYRTREVDYVNRKRNLLLENDRMFAQSALEQLDIGVKMPDRKLNILSKMMGDEKEQTTQNYYKVGLREVIEGTKGIEFRSLNICACLRHGLSIKLVHWF